MNIITRFAPSPTGLLHIGSARTALFNYLFAKNNSGKFLLRIEDTDKKRSTKEAVDVILDGLNWLGLNHDQAIIFQSHNYQKHQEIALKLLENNQAYYCYTSTEELAELRQNSQNKNEVFRFKSPWRDKQPSQHINSNPVIRIKSPIDGSTIINDLVQGKVEVSNSELDDLIILRSDKTPTYNLAVVVDDYDMKVTHIIRGDDHLNNSFRQKIIYQAMGWKIPEFAHIPLIYGPDGSKMSKRHGATSVLEYKEMGYLPEAIRNYLLRLGWSHGNDEIISDGNAIKWFNLEHIGKSPARFDFDKLNNLNKYYIKEKSSEELFNLISSNLEEKTKLIKAIEFLKQRSSNLNELENELKIYENDYKKDLEQSEKELLNSNKELINELKGLINSIKIWNHDRIKESINNYCQEKSLKMKQFGPILRIIITFSSKSSGGIFDIMDTIGKEELIKRFELI